MELPLSLPLPSSLAASGGAPQSAPPLFLLAPPSEAASVSVINRRKMFYDDGDYVVELNTNGLHCGSGKMAWKNGYVYEGKCKAGTKDG